MLPLAVSLVFVLAVSALPKNLTTFDPPRKIGKRCTGIIESLTDVAAAQECTTINIAGFTVPAGQTFAIAPPDGAVISLTGEITFAVANWAGPLMSIRGNSITFNGNGHVINGNGDQYCGGDGLGGSGGVEKPDPMITLSMSGEFENVEFLNSPERCMAINTNGLTVTGVTINNAAGAVPNSRSNGQPAGANTDGFDVAASNILIQNSVVTNQDDCFAIDRGTNVTFTRNSCTGGHGISIGSIPSGTSVSDITITNNVVTNNVNGLRIKTDATATGSTVSNIIYSGNSGTATEFGVLVDQSYPAILGTPGTGVVISNIQFTGTNTFTVGSTGHRVEVNCGSTSSCTGIWNFAGLTVTGGTGSTVKNAPVTGGSF